MFTTLIVQPIFNLLVLIYALIPGHNFGLAIILFTVLVRLLMWPLVKKQLNHAKAMRELQPEIRKIKAATKGERQKESALTMELYKEREINPFASLGIALVQIPILIGLYLGLTKIIKDPNQIIDFSYPILHNLSWMKHIDSNISNFDNSLFGAINLTRMAVESKGIYIPAMIIVIASALAQYFQTKQMMPQDPEARGLRQILREAGKGNQADASEMSVATSRTMMYLIPFLVFIIAIRLAVALPLYWLTSSLVAYIQQSRVLRRDAKEADDSVTLDEPKPARPKPKKNKKRAASKRRR